MSNLPVQPGEISRLAVWVTFVMAGIVFAGLFAAGEAVQPAAAAETVVFAVIGDYGLAGEGEALVADLVNSWNPDFIITLGDNNYEVGAAAAIDRNIGQYFSDYIGSYQGSYGSGSVTNRFWPSLGNHDWYTSNAQPYLDYFTLPGNERYYEVDLGLVHLFAVDSDINEPDGITAGSVQGQWLQAALGASTACLDVVYFHHAAYSSALHGSDARLQWPFAAWGADVVMAGHDHTYERISAHGIPYFVNGLGGRSLYPFSNIGNLPAGVVSEFRYNAAYGAMRVTVTAFEAVYEFFNVSGQLIDSLAVEKTCAAFITSSPTVTDTPFPSATLPLKFYAPVGVTDE